MRLATICSHPKAHPRDGLLVVINHAGDCCAPVPQVPTLLGAFESWESAEHILREQALLLEQNKSESILQVAQQTFCAPLPRTWAWLDGSAFVQHVILVRKARNAEPPADLYDVPLMYQGVSDHLIGPQSALTLLDEAYGMDFEAELCVVTDDVPVGTSASEALKHIKLILVMNDVSLRNLIPRELATGFGFFHSKPASSFAPYALTPDELGSHWQNGRVLLPVISTLNGQQFGAPCASEMYFSFGQLIAHASRTRALSAGTIIGSGTISNADSSRGQSCIAERRMLETIAQGAPSTPFMKAGDSIRIEVLMADWSPFGAIDQRVIS